MMRFLKLGWLAIIGVMASGTYSHAAQYSTKDVGSIAPVVALEVGDLQQRHCLYAGKSYSEGAMITTANIVLECRPASAIELNGALKWIERTHKPDNTDLSNSITINK
ncbi:hypothetical protein PMAL9190_01690 [Photobacterium malacitanum]|uniref:DUF1496 domain-containing protein n=1 Tax=Photobacterium malacitanum TaxID=2204294 RepID=A0A1Y6MH02_9GAMM|nr:DUF1496 domain-containing protein [Photobacterium malacitanum]SMY34481.1 hypothetical protein PMAL9190_01690 [Photobacterium malacitanum]